MFESKYISELTENSPKYKYSNCHLDGENYQSVQINVAQSGTYTVISYASYKNSQVRNRGYLYTQHFDPNKPEEQLILYEDHRACVRDDFFEQVIDLVSNNTYVFVSILCILLREMPFAIRIYGPNYVTFNHIGNKNLTLFSEKDCISFHL